MDVDIPDVSHLISNGGQPPPVPNDRAINEDTEARLAQAYKLTQYLAYHVHDYVGTEEEAEARVTQLKQFFLQKDSGTSR